MSSQQKCTLTQTYTGIPIHADSFHPEAHKMAIINSSIQRLLHISLDEAAVRQETQIIQSIAQTNGLNIDVAHKTETTTATFGRNFCLHSWKQTQMVVITILMGQGSKKPASEFRRYEYRVGFYSVTTVSNLFNLKDPKPIPKKSRIYRAHCGECDASYYGQTLCYLHS